MRRRLAVLLVLALVLSGCTGSPPQDRPDTIPEGGEDPDDDPDDGPRGAPKPNWAPGLWWSYTFTRDGATHRVTLAVAETTATEHTLLANDTTHPLFDALLDISYVGPVRASDLAGYEGDDPVRFFTWPLQDDATWTTTWNGAERHLTAHRANVTTPRGPEPGFEIVSRTGPGDDDPVQARFTYAPSVAWFNTLELPRQNVTYELVDQGFGYRGNLTRANLTTHVDQTGPGLTPATFEVANGSDLVVGVLEADGRSTGSLQLVAPNGTRYGVPATACDAAACAFLTVRTAPAAPGTWQAEVAGGSLDGGFRAAVHEATLAPVPVVYG